MEQIKHVWLLFIFTGVSLFACAEVKLPKIFSSNMVLQHGMEIRVWGWSDNGERISVSFNNKTVRTRAGKEGTWQVRLPIQKAGGPFTMVIKGNNTIELDNVMVGEVWVCSGQSNMTWRVDNSNNPEQELASADIPDIRLFSVPKTVAQFPQDDISEGEWEECSPETVAGFSAVGYFFGRNLHRELNVPIGLIHTSWGGTVAETWMSPDVIIKDPDFKNKLIELQQTDIKSYWEKRWHQIRQLFGNELPAEDIGMNGDEPVWAGPDFDDNDWGSIKTHMYWESQGYMDIDGIGWYRKEINLNEEQTNTSLILHLGKIDDSDITFFNGFQVGKTERKHDQERVYTIDKKYLKQGKNVLAVRVQDTGGNGGMWGNPENQYLVIGNEKRNISGEWKFRISKPIIASMDIRPNSYPTLLFNAMIHPLLPYGIKGVIWYQGESNVRRAKQYERIFPNLITDWRNHWNQGEFPFLFVSLANYTQPPDQPGDSEWAELREAQTKALSLPNTGMSVTIDIGEADDIHPRNKQDVGKRLSLNALKIAYGKDIVHSGPMYSSVEFKNGRAIITFSETGSGLKVNDANGILKGFSIAGTDKKFHWAKAELINKNTVAVYSENVHVPVAVRYGWANNPDNVNLYNEEGLPANPFRTDNWPGIAN